MYGYNEVIAVETKRRRNDYEGTYYSQDDIARRIERDMAFYARRLDAIAPTGNENVALMREVLAYAKAEINKTFDMNLWFGQDTDDEIRQPAGEPLKCGTTMCLAGTAAFFTLSDNEVITNQDEIFALDALGRKRPKTVVSIEERGQQMLGLTEEQADTLFYLINDVEVVEVYMNFIAGERLLPEVDATS